jgi:hypothetical protein
MLFLRGLSSLVFFVLGKDDRSVVDHSHNGCPAAAASTSTALCAKTKTLEVCLSPGCLADGAEGVLLKMQALVATPDMEVVSGVCCSLCGNGPVVMDVECGKKYRKVSEQKILDILLQDEATSSSSLDPNQQAVLEGFNLCFEGGEALNNNDYSAAVEKFSMGIDMGLEAALVLDEQRKSDDDTGATTASNGLKWLIVARCNEAKAKLGMGDDMEGAIASAQSAYDLSGKTSTESLELLHEACQRKGDDVGELNALKSLFDLPEPEKPSAMQTNKRRSLGFRLAKLKATVKSK